LAQEGVANADAVAARLEDDTLTLQGAADVLSSAGLSARVVRVSAEELPHLRLPALVGLDDGVALLASLRTSDASLVTRAGDASVERTELARRFSGLALDTTPAMPDGALPVRLGAVLLAQRGLLARVALAAAVTSALGIATPVLSSAIIDRALPHAAVDLLSTLIAGVLIVGLHAEWFGWLRDRIVVDLGARVEKAITQGALDHLLRLPLAEAQRSSVGERLETLASAQRVSEVASRDFIALGVQSSLAVPAAIFLVVVDPLVAAFVVAAAASLAFGTFAIGRYVAQLEAGAIDAMARRNALTFELVRGIQAFKVAAAESWMVRTWRAQSTRVLDQQLAIRKTSLFVSSFQDLAEGVVSAALIYWLGRGALAHTISNGQLVAMLQSAVLVVSVGGIVGTTSVQFWQVVPHYRRLGALMATPVEPRAPRCRPQDLGEEAIVLEDVWFRHAPDAPWVLRGTSMRLARGQVHELTGGSGTGKTTFLRLVAGLYRPERGSVRIGGIDAIDARDWVTYLPQDTRLVAGTILENLRLLSGGAPFERIRRAAEATGLGRVLAAWPGGLETRVGTDGDGISGGQRQLVALTAAIASERPVLLLDEATSNLDRASRARLERSGVFEGKTVLAAVHDPLPGREARDA
jgi:ABC-type bacteriocin/lantibiotic exporter with double-glycine peptidase domain